MKSLKLNTCLKLDGFKSAAFSSLTEECLRGDGCNCDYSFLLSVRARRLDHCTCVFCPSSPFSLCFLSVLLSNSAKQPQGKDLSTQKHPWCNHISIFPKANKQFSLSDHVLLIAKLSNLMGYLKLQSLWVKYLSFLLFTEHTEMDKESWLGKVCTRKVCP